MLTPVIDTSKEYGLVLEGGGAKGAYQIGAWKALKEAGVKINAVAGTSVGALNGALICMDELEMAQQMWSNLTYSQVMDVDDTRMEQLMEGEAPFWEAVKDAFRHMSEGGVDVTPLKDMLDKVVDEEKIRNSSIADTGKKVNYFGQKPLVFFQCSVTIIDSTDNTCREHII